MATTSTPLPTEATTESVTEPATEVLQDKTTAIRLLVTTGTLGSLVVNSTSAGVVESASSLAAGTRDSVSSATSSIAGAAAAGALYCVNAVHQSITSLTEAMSSGEDTVTQPGSPVHEAVADTAKSIVVEVQKCVLDTGEEVFQPAH